MVMGPLRVLSLTNLETPVTSKTANTRDLA